jgi:hypothetical protein
MNIKKFALLSINTLTFWIILLNLIFDIQFIRYYLLILLIYGTYIDYKASSNLSKYVGVHRYLFYILHVIVHYVIPSIMIYYYKVLSKPLNLDNYIYGLFVGFLYLCTINDINIYNIDRKNLCIHNTIIWTLMFIFSNIFNYIKI